MTGRLRALLLIITALPLFAAPLAFAQTSMRRATPQFLGTLKPGQWIQLEGTPQRDNTMLCTEVKVLTGDFIDDDWEIRGALRNINPKAREFYISRYRVRLKEVTEFDDDGLGKFKAFSDMRPGQVVKLEGTYMKDGSFLAKEVNDESAKQIKKAGSGWNTRVQIVGKIEAVNPSRLSISSMGTTFYIGDQTKLKSVIK